MGANLMRSAKTILLSILILLVILLGACQGETSDGDADSLYGELETLSPDGALVVYWHASSGADEDRLVELIDDFNATNEWGITVVGEYQGELETLYDRVITGLPGGQLPNLVMSDPSLAAAYASQEAAVALASYLTSEKWGFTQAERDDFFSSALTADRLPQFGNQLYSFPSCRSLQVLYYNVDWLKELEFGGPPETWDEFREMACAASRPVNDLYGFELGMDSAVFTSLLATQQVSPLNAGATAYTMGGAQGRTALQFLQGLMGEGCALWESEEGARLPDFAAGKILFAIDSTANLAAYRRATVEGANFTWTLAALPHTTEQPLVGVSGTGLAILRSNPKEQLAAWLFIKWLAEPAQQARWSQQMACFPIRRSAFEEMEGYLEAHPQYSLAAQLLEREWITEPNVTGYRGCRAGIGRLLYAVTAGETVEQWFNETLNLCNQTLEDATS
jgi:multiple sugar transport system substrate-binding protein/sn-glycerol 3-phosphate transport system substrate-binding protein